MTKEIPLDTVQDLLNAVKVGDKVKFVPDSNDRLWWTVTAIGASNVVAVQQVPFEAKGELRYTVVATQDYRYNFVGPGLVRSSLNSMGGGWDVGPEGSNSQSVLDALESGDFEISRRRLIDLRSVIVCPS